MPAAAEAIGSRYRFVDGGRQAGLSALLLPPLDAMRCAVSTLEPSTSCAFPRRTPRQPLSQFRRVLVSPPDTKRAALKGRSHPAAREPDGSPTHPIRP